MKAQIQITEANEKRLFYIKKIATINSIDVSNKEKLVNYSIEVAAKLMELLDEESLLNLINLKKSV